MTIELHPEARAELQEAVDWYADRDIEVASAFLAAVDMALREVEAHPMRFRMRTEFGARQRVVRRFPYSIFYEVSPDGVTFVLAVAHQRRKPGYWEARR